MLRKDKWPELPPGYAYECSASRIYITHPIDGRRQHIYIPNTVQHRYWNNPLLAAVAAWKHAYTQLKEATHAQTTH